MIQAESIGSRTESAMLRKRRNTAHRKVCFSFRIYCQIYRRLRKSFMGVWKVQKMMF